MIKITCTSCSKPLTIDETKLPMKEVSFPCPSCKTKLSFDRSKPAEDEGASVAALMDDDDDVGFGKRALIIGVDKPEIRQAVKAAGYSPVHKATAVEGRDYYSQEIPGLVILSPSAPSPPPIDEMVPMTSIMPGDRRRGFFVLVGDNLRTLDGNAAFLYQVNLVVASKDLGSFPKVFDDAYRYHTKLYNAMNDVLT